ncbi:uncharacterized protein BDCG_03787 [Blastomyces dermatitidis ER-3]|uniref:Uncharacterized protein n=2 Tax=Ajellomyces dermatitidis TaxID=5039 RepID=F2T2Q4_AJEDA|nr:uncharacterized protein BDCG_03787 [Blastomyces dermatitidis ER-3]EEQ88667.2 hypothetical protein BDCG_03787 [Blastomyces dermatitidis ER-3]EGE77164.1 hypothetical protein BDDG_00101 [Blastomyces dermatitidis ATCC 18188]EQL38781.1 hypothetical protein BDFG_00312 [Blastomyces dermatitidis ATCC 26199]
MSTAMAIEPRQQPDRTESLASSAATHVARPRPSGSISDQASRGDTRASTNPSSYVKSFDVPSADRKLASAGAAASLAHAGYTTREINKVETEHPLRNPQLTSTSSQAACQAVRTTQKKPTSHEKEPPRKNAGARLAATGALSKSRKRAVSAPPVPNDSSHLTHAVTAASTSHKMSFRPATVPEETRAETPLDIGKVHEAAMVNARRDLQPEAEDNIHERAVMMARQMFSAMPQVETTTASINSRRPLSLHETAQRLASEKLDMMHDEQKAFRDYYSAAIPPPRRHRSLHSKFGKRATSDSGVTDIDNEQSEEIRSQMTIFRRRMARVDAEKMARDHEALMNAATRNAEAVIDDVDRRIYESTGRPQPRVTEKLISRPVENANVVPIGAGQFVTQKDVSRVARSKAKPTIEDVMRRLEEQRARVIEEELDEREALRQRELEKEREKEARKCVQEVKEEERKNAKTQKESKKLLRRRLSKSSRGGLFRRKSAKARGKVPAREEEAPASGALTDHRAPQDEEEDDWVQVPEKQSPPRSQPTTSSAGESSQSIFLEPPRESLSRHATTASNKTQSGGSEKSSSRSKLWSRKKRESAEGEPSPPSKTGDAGRASGSESERRKSAPATAPTVAPLAAPSDGTQATNNSPSSISARPVWSSSTESSRVISDRKKQQEGGGGVLRRRSMKTKWHLRFFGKLARRPRLGAGPGSFEVQRERPIVQTTAPAPPAAASLNTGSEVTSEPLQTIPSQKSSTDTPTNPSKFTENL